MYADMFPPGTDFIIAYMESPPAFDGSCGLGMIGVPGGPDT